MSVLVPWEQLDFEIFLPFRDRKGPTHSDFSWLTSQQPCWFYQRKGLPFFGNYTHIFHENSAKETS